MSADPALRIATPEPTPASPIEELPAAEAVGRKARAATVLTTTVEPLLVDTEQAAAACGIGRATWFRLKSAGKTPAPVKLAGRVLYRLTDLRLWVSLGCPPRREFEARRAAVDASGRPR
jgi:predicted DNA-binding transcriptional regulator AlpA